MEEQKEILTAKEAGEYLSMGRATIIRMCERGDLPGVRVGKRWRLRRSDIDALFAPDDN